MPRPDIGQISARMPIEPLQAARPRIGRHRVAQLRKLEVPILTCRQESFHSRLQPNRNEVTQHRSAYADPIFSVNSVGLRHPAECTLN